MSPPAIGSRVTTIYLPTGAAVETRAGTVAAVNPPGWFGYLSARLDDIGDGGVSLLCVIANRGLTWEFGEASDTRTSLIAAFLLSQSAA